MSTNIDTFPKEDLSVNKLSKKKSTPLQQKLKPNIFVSQYCLKADGRRNLEHPGITI